MFLPRALNEKRGFEITGRPYYILCPCHQPTIEFNFKHEEDLAPDFVKPHSYLELNH
jgi:hypothetical protein